MVSLRRILLRGSLSIAALLTLMAGCGSLMTLNASRKKFDPGNDTKPLPPAEDPFMVEAADRFGLMALFAEVVYRKDFEAKSRDGRGCGYLNGQDTGGDEDQLHLRYGMPRTGEGKGGWKRWVPPPPLNGVSPCFDRLGLYYETYIHEGEDHKITEAVLAFRGTENRRGQYLYDWSTNGAAAFGFEPKQYALARTSILQVIERLRDRFESDGREVRIYATGHSLGGGLAQQAGYLSRDVKEVFTFDTTPVTNWSHLRKLKKVRNAYPIIHRVYNGGEFLEKVRFVSTSFTRARFGRHDIGLQFDKRSPFRGHSMRTIACNFARLIGLRRPLRDAEHHYPARYIIDQMWATGDPRFPGAQICSPGPEES